MLLLFLIMISFSLTFSDIVARINGRVITKKEFEGVFKTYWKEILHFSPGKPRKEDRRRFLFEYVKSLILEDVAASMGVSVSDEEVRRKLRAWGIRRPSPLVERFARKEIVVAKLENLVTKEVKVSDEEVEAYYLLNKREFYYPNQVKLLRVIAEDKKKAERVYRALKKGRPVPKEKGVVVGRERWYSIQALPKRIRRKLWPYKVGRVSKPVRLEGGYLVLKIIDKRKAGFLPLSEVRDRVRRKLLRMKKEEVFRKWFREVLKGYRLEVYLKEL